MWSLCKMYFFFLVILFQVSFTPQNPGFHSVDYLEVIALGATNCSVIKCTGIGKGSDMFSAFTGSDSSWSWTWKYKMINWNNLYWDMSILTLSAAWRGGTTIYFRMIYLKGLFRVQCLDAWTESDFNLGS